MAHPMKNKEYTVTITGCTSQGEGVAHLEDGLTVFIRGTLTGEVCRISIMKAAKRCAWARLIQVISPSPARVQPDCPHYPKCGGCQSRHMSYQEELQLKAERVNDAFHHIGGLSLMIDKIHGAPAVNGYRNKVQFPVGGSLEEGVKAGQIVREWMVRYQVAPYNEQLHTGLVRHVFCRENSKGDLLVCLIANGKKLPRERELVEALKKELPGLTSVVLSVNTEKTNVILGKRYRTLWGQDYLLDTLCSLTFRLSVPSFFQVNREQAQLLYERAVEFASLTGKETVLDLYCGTGTISQCMAKRPAGCWVPKLYPKPLRTPKPTPCATALTTQSSSVPMRERQRSCWPSVDSGLTSSR